MKKTLLLASLLAGSQALAAPFVYPQNWMAEPASTVKRGGELRQSIISDFKGLNPFTSKEAVSLPGTYFGAGTGLFTQDPANDKPIPVMAESMPNVSNGGKRFVVNIRRGMKFSDGQDITADDFVSTMKIHLDDKVGSNSYDGFLVDGKPMTIRKLDAYTVQFDFPKPVATAYFKMTFAPWPDHVFGQAYRAGGAEAIKKLWPLSTNPAQIVVPGAWTLESYQAGQRAVVKRNEHFGEWNVDATAKPLPYLDRISIRVVSDLNASLAAFLGGQIDTFAPRNADDLAQIRRAIDSGTLKAALFPNVSPQASSQWMVFNWNRSSDPFKQNLFRDARFRHAMSHLANRQAMIQLALGGVGTESYYSVYPVFRKWYPAQATTYKYNPAAASKLLAELGFTRKNSEGYLVNAQGKVLEFTLSTNAGNTVREQLGRIFTDEARKVGVKVNFTPINFNNLVDQLYEKGENRSFDAILLGLTGSNNVWPFGANVVNCGGSLHSYNNPTNGRCLVPQEQLMSKLFTQGEQQLDPEKRLIIGKKLLEIESALQPVVYLVGANYHVTFNSRLAGNYPRELWDSYYTFNSAFTTTWIKP